MKIRAWIRRWLPGAVTSSLVASLITGCGGEVRNSEPTPPGTSKVAADTDAGTGTSGPGATVELPECALGSEHAVTGQCAFLTASRCYETKLEACACACAKRSGTTCIDGFPDQNGTTMVICN